MFCLPGISVMVGLCYDDVDILDLKLSLKSLEKDIKTFYGL